MMEALGSTARGASLSPVKRRLLERWLQGDTAAVGAPAIPRRGDTGPAPLSFSQLRLWFLDQMTPGNPFYNVPMAVPMPVLTDPRVLERSVNEIVRRHEALRTRLGALDGRPVQIVEPDLAIPLTVVSLRRLPRLRRRTEVQRLAAEEARRPFDLSRGPLLRTMLLDLAEEGFVFLLTIHHIVSDGWSMGVFFQELGALYASFAAGKPSPLPELPIQYADFAVWRRDLLRGPGVEEQLAYWKAQLQDLPALQLPTDRPRPPVPSYRGAHHDVRWSKTVTEGLRALGMREGTTLFMTALAGFACLLYRYTGQSDLVIGSPIANRNRPELELLIGFFVNSLVLRIPVRGEDPFRDVLQRVKETTLEAYTRQDVPFEMLVEKLQPERDPSRNPLFQVTFQIANTPASGALRDSGGPSHRVEQGTAIFDLAVNLSDTPQGLRGQIEYSSDLFEAATVERLTAHLESMLEGAVRNPATTAGRLPLLSFREERQLLREWNATKVRFAPFACVHELFEAQVRRTPHAVAVVSGTAELTYEALNRRANQVAHDLIAHGAAADSLVALCVERSLDMVVGLLGILKAGGAYLPLDPSYPEDRLFYMMRDARCALLLTQERLLSSGKLRPDPGTRGLCLDREPAEIGAQGGGDPAHRTGLGDLAYVLYTSGSRGRPKGVMIPHLALANHMAWMQKRFPLSPSDRVLQRTSLSFDASVWELYAPLLAGACLVLAPAAADLDPQALAATLVDQGITTLQLVPSLLRMLVEEPAFVRCTSLRRLFCGGEALHADLLSRVFDVLGANVEVVNLYGPTEAAIDTTCHVCARTAAGLAVPIGRPVSNSRVYVLDALLNPVPVGVPGELYIGGSGLARGYLGQPELTGSRFIADPFSSEPGQRLFKTGDLARYRADGNLEFLGRIDDQIKLRGFRIETGEIEAVLRQHAGVAEVVVLLREDRSGTSRLTAYLTAHSGASLSVAELRGYLKEKVPDFMVPSAFVVLGSLPLSPNGKLDRKALPAPDATRRKLEDFVAPRSEAEQILAGIWREVLGVERIGVHENFFELGGDSILSIQIIARARQAGLALAPQQIFQYQTIAELAAAAPAVTAVEAEQGPVTGPVPLTPVQHWFFEQDRADPHHFNQAVLLELPWRVEPASMRVATAHLIEHHDALRLRFVRTGQGWRQIDGAPQEPTPFEHIDLTACSEADARWALEEAAAQLHASLDLSDGPILRVVLCSLAKSTRLLIIIHHLAVDGVSWRILLDDLLGLAWQLSRGEPAALPPKTTSFKRWAERCVEYAAASSLPGELAYWLRLAACPAPLPVDLTAGDNTVGSAESVVVALDEEATRALLHDVPAAYRTQINDALLAALGQALAGWTQRGTHLVDLEGHGREALFPEVDLSRTVGWFTSLCPVLLEVGERDAPGDALKNVKETLRALPQRGIGYGLLRYLAPDAEVRKKLRALPQAEISFNYLGQLGTGQPGTGQAGTAPESTGLWYSPRGRRAHLLEVNAAIEAGRLRVHWTFSRNVHRPATIEAVAHTYLAALRAIIAHCQSAGSGGYTPSDFAKAGLTQQQLDLLMKKVARSEPAHDERKP